MNQPSCFSCYEMVLYFKSCGIVEKLYFLLADWNLTVSSVIHEEVAFEPFVETRGRTVRAILCWWSSFYLYVPKYSSLLLSFEVSTWTRTLIRTHPYHPGMYLKQGLWVLPEMLPKG